METNYELKHKCLLVPLKVVLLVLAMALVGLPTFAQSGKSVKVANDQQLIEAMDNPSIASISLEPGYYAYLDVQATWGTRVKKSQGDGNRSSTGCTYTIVADQYCYRPNEVSYDEQGNLLFGYALGEARAGVSNTTCNSFPVPCCPPSGSGRWAVASKPAGSTIVYYDTTAYVMNFWVSMPGQYILNYTWDPILNPALVEYAFVEIEYNFFGPVAFDFSAPDVCGLTTLLDFTFIDGYDPNNAHVIEWFVDYLPYGDPVPFTGPQVTVEDFPFTVAECGVVKIIARHTLANPSDCNTEVIRYVDFSCEPEADAGPDINVCNDICYYSLVGSTGLYSYSPTHAWSWIQLSGPNDLVFDDQTGLVTGVCVDPLADCPYGVYEVEFQVQNGQCYDEDAAFLHFYEQPVADAGDDQHLCNTFSFSLNALPYVYCGTEGVNYWSVAHWELVSQADPAAVVTIVDPSDPNTTININTASADCAFGEYVFVWTETNVKPGEVGGCESEDLVVITIYEDPAPDAGDDMVFCNTFAFTLYGIGDTPCYENTVVVYSWEKSEQPGDCQVTFTPADEPQTIVEFVSCDPDLCKYGKYVFTLTQSNGYMDGNNFVEICTTEDDVEVWIFEDVVANAGPDQEVCDEFAFSLGAIPTVFCGEADVNYFTWGEWSLVSGPTTAVTFSDINDPASGVVIDDASVECPYGSYTFMWTEYNGFGTPFQGCWDEDLVTIVISETPESISAGSDLSFCEIFTFTLDGAVDMPCTQQTAYTITWELIDQPGDCDVTIAPYTIDPAVTIANCAPCQYGEYIFKVTQVNGFFNDQRVFVPVCEDSDFVSVWIFEEPLDVYAGEDLLLCNDFAFSLTATGAEYCGDLGVNYNNWYSWVLVSGPAGADCEVNILSVSSLSTGVIIENCLGECAYGEWVFGFTEFNGNDDAYCSDYDEVSVFIFEQPVADAGDDFAACVDIDYTTYCYNLTASLEPCYSMNGLWTKSCGPGDVVFTDVASPVTEICFTDPGHYEFTWTVWNAALDCEDSDEVVFDLIEQPTATGGDDYLIAPCDELCYSLLDAGIVKYEYFGTDQGECPNFQDLAYWSYISGPTGNPAEVTFADDTDPATEMCVSTFGCYTVRWTEVNKQIDGDLTCESYFDVFVQFVETPEPNAGEDASLCDSCYTMTAEPYTANNCADAQTASYWLFYNYVAPVDPCTTDEFAIDYTPLIRFSDPNDPNAEICVIDDCLGSHYGTYGFIWVNESGYCIGQDTVYIEFKKIPEDLALEGLINPTNCLDTECPNCEVSCLYPDEHVIEVCAGACLTLGIDWMCSCFGAPIPGYTYEWSFIGPSGSYMQAEPYWYDCAAECWRGSDEVYICFGECCDTARLYLTITTPQGCTTTEEWKFYVNHLPCAEIEGPAVSEVDAINTYCNVCPTDYDMSCLLYTWTAEHCGIIVDGQGTECIEVLWTDYNVNGGWGEITLTTYDTCTGCCNYDEMAVRIYPSGTLGEATLSGHVLYHNNQETPLNGVEITLWNGTIPVMTTTSFNDIEGGNGLGYFEFTGISAITNFGITATYGAPWYGANATDALAVELKTINNLPGGFTYDDVVADAMDVNNNGGISATDALWIKQRAIGMIGYFPAGNWVFDPTLSTTAVTGFELFALNAGDANRSNNPNSNKSIPAIDLISDGTMNVVTGEVFELPIRIAEAGQFGAITLELEYNPALIEVVEVEAMEGMLSNINNGVVSIAWSNLNTMVLSDNDVIVTLKAKATSEIASTETLFRIGMNSEFADQSAKVIEPVTLKSFGVTTAPAALDYFLSANRPNPFSTSTTIEYTMPETGEVKLSVLDMLGQELAVIVDATQTAGTYSVEFSAAGLATGVYIYKITVDGETRDFISTQRMVISH